MNSTSSNELLINSTLIVTSSTNVTSQDVQYYDIPLLKTVSFVFCLTASLYLLYIMLVLFIYGYKTKLLVGCKENPYNSCRNKTVMHLFILLAAFFVFVYVSLGIPLVRKTSQLYCAVVVPILYLCNGFSIGLIYFVLWFRVYTSFYANRLLKVDVSKWMRSINKLSIALMFVLGTATAVYSLSIPGMVATETSCEDIPSQKGNKLKFVLFLITAITFQFTSLISFVYPLCGHRRKMLNHGFDADPTYRVVKRSTVVASVCILSDVSAVMIEILSPHPSFRLGHIVFSCNLIINLMGVIVCFANWKERIFPFKYPFSPPKRTESIPQLANVNVVDQQHTDASHI